MSADTLVDLRATIADRVVEDGDCLRWTGSCVNGHPYIRLSGRSMLVRRALWESERGPIPAGRILRCTCGLQRCINLDHAKLTTYRAVGKELGALGVMSGPVRSARIAAVKRAGKQAKISQQQAREIRHSDESSTVLAARYGLSVSTVCRIRNGQMRREFAGNPFAGLYLGTA